MAIRDTRERYGLVSRGLHWAMAAAIFGMFALGCWMVRLDYYDPYYTRAPSLHRAAGMFILFMLLMRIGWRLSNVKPIRSGLTAYERKTSRIVHLGFYLLLIVLTLSGYLISTSDGRAIDVFGWLQVPSLIENKTLASPAGTIHRWSAYSMMLLAAIHSIAAIKHAIGNWYAATPRASALQPHTSTEE